MRSPRRSDALDPELDARLVARCLAGEPRAWDALVRRHERLVYAVARSWRLSDEDLGDCFQEVFAALVKGLPRLRDARTLVRWLSSTTERVARTIALRRRREQALQVSEPEVLDNQPADGAPLGADLERLESQALVRLAMSGLSERCQRLLLALYYEDPAPPYAQLARRLGVPVGSLGPTRARCMEKLRERLESSPGGISGDTGGTSGAVTGKRSRDVRRSASPPVSDSRAEEP
jgi:RNA polymerase sigma factor (sigma-70 family)